MPAAQGQCPLDAAQLEATIERLAHDIVSGLRQNEAFVLVGIRSRGLPRVAAGGTIGSAHA